MQRLTVFKSRFFWKLYLAYSALFIVIAALMIWLVTYKIQSAMMADVTASLREKIALLIPYSSRTFNEGPSPELEARLRELGLQANARITLIRADGTVIEDSHFARGDLGNHADRPEVRAAIGGDYGTAQRMSSSAKEEMLYLAKAVRAGSGADAALLGVVRVGIPLARLDKRMADVRTIVLLVGLLGMALALVVGLVLARRVSDPVTEIMIVADAMRKGQYSARVGELATDEMGRLGDTLNKMGEEVTRRIATISQERAQLKAMLAGMVEGIIAVDDDNRILFCNRTVDSLFRTSATESRGKTLAEVGGLGVVATLVEGARRTRELVKEEIRIGEGDGQLMIETHANPFQGERTSGVIVVLHDVTDLRRLERVRRDFVANVSHELKTPLTSIKGYVETLLNGALAEPDNSVRFLQKIDRNVARLVNLVQDILSLARVESSDEGIKAVPVEWGPIVRSVVAQHEDDFTEKSLRLELKDLGEPMVVYGDKEAMTQVLDNLVNNAIKYTPRGGSVSVVLRRDSREGCIEVADTGIGIPRKHLDRIFERFYRVDKARSREMGGTGLGLSIVKHLVAGMNGRVGVESQVGVGSRFSVRLELAH